MPGICVRRFAVHGVDLLAPVQGAINVVELQQTERGVELAHLAVDAGGDDRHFVDEAEILQVVDACFGLRIRADDRAALEGVEHLGGVEAQHRQVTVAQQAAA